VANLDLNAPMDNEGDCPTDAVQSGARLTRGPAVLFGERRSFSSGREVAPLAQ